MATLLTNVLCFDTLPTTLNVLPFYFRCNEDYRGSRCEHFQLPIMGKDAGEAGLIASVIVVALLILVVLAFVIYYTHK